jgi:hypothetical protein
VIFAVLEKGEYKQIDKFVSKDDVLVGMGLQEGMRPSACYRVEDRLVVVLWIPALVWGRVVHPDSIEEQLNGVAEQFLDRA